MGYKNIKLSFNPLVPKRGTRMEFRKMQDVKVLKNKIRIIRTLVGHSAQVTFESIQASYLQYLINSADENNSVELIEKLDRTANGSMQISQSDLF